MTIPYFYNIKMKTIVVLLKQFNNISITRKDNNSISVPVVYARKASFYQRLNDNKGGKTQITLPAMSLDDVSFNYNPDRQANNLSFGITNIRKENQNIMQYMKNPSPIDIEFELTIKAVYAEDLERIKEQIIPMFQPSKVISVNLIPEMGITIDLTYTLMDIEDKKENNFTDDPTSNKDFECVLTFKTTTYYFPEIKQRYITRQIDVYNDSLKTSITDNMSPDALISDSLLTFADYDLKQLKYIEFDSTTSDRYNKIYIVDLTSELTSEGENMKVIDENGDELEFVFEYDNGEFYSSDNYIPTGVTANKTGNMYIAIPFIEADKTYKIFIYTNHTEAYYFARDIFHSYNDFNIRSFKYVNIEDKLENDLTYINDGDLYIKSISTSISNIAKVYTKNSMDGNKTIKIGVSSYTWESEKFVCGVTDGSGNHMYIKCASTSNQYSIYTYNGSETLKFTLNPAATLTEITMSYDGTNWTITCNSTSNSFVGDDYVTPFLTNNGTSLARYDYFYMYDSVG